MDADKLGKRNAGLLAWECRPCSKKPRIDSPSNSLTHSGLVNDLSASTATRTTSGPQIPAPRAPVVPAASISDAIIISDDDDAAPAQPNTGAPVVPPTTSGTDMGVRLGTPTRLPIDSAESQPSQTGPQSRITDHSVEKRSHSHVVSKVSTIHTHAPLRLTQPVSETCFTPSPARNHVGRPRSRGLS